MLHHIHQGLSCEFITIVILGYNTARAGPSSWDQATAAYQHCTQWPEHPSQLSTLSGPTWSSLSAVICHGGTGWKQDEVWTCSFQGLCLAVLKASYFHPPCDYFSVHFCVCFSMILVFIFTTFCANFYIIYSIWNKNLVCNVICLYFIFFTNWITFDYRMFHI